MATDPHLCHTNFAPFGLNTAGHMFEVVIIEKDTFEVIDDDIDGTVRGIPVTCGYGCRRER